MCGLVGVVRRHPDAPAIDPGLLERARDALAARGPDGQGLWLAHDGGCGLAHRRLALIDPGPGGAQPRLTRDGRHALLLDGEIYNYRDLRAGLCAQGRVRAEAGDSEVLLALLVRDGAAALAALEGMFACALWDARERRLLLARDPYGIKPLYYAEDRGRLWFASQVRALDAAGLPPAHDPAALAAFLLWGFVPEPLSLRRAVRALPAGHLLEVRDGEPAVPRRWSPSLPPAARQRALDAAPDVGALRAACEHSLRRHLVADVPLGVLLSSGVDSALVAALATRVQGHAPPMITLAVEGAPDERPRARALARALGAEHHEQFLTRAELETLWPAALDAMDQPSVDGFNVFLAARAAQQAGLKGVLSGLGGDELCGSYPAFHQVPQAARWAATLRALPGGDTALELAGRAGGPWRPKLRGLGQHLLGTAGAYFLRRALYLPEELPAILGRERAAEGLAAYDALGEVARQIEAPAETRGQAELSDSWSAVQRCEWGLYLRSQLLRDADWAALAHGLELRLPYVFAPLVSAFAEQGYEPARSSGKVALARALCPDLPARLWARHKGGFIVPVPPDSVRLAAGLAARRRALRVLRRFGVDVPLHERERGGTLYLATEAFLGAGGIQRYTRDVVQALQRCRPGEPLTVLALNEPRGAVREPEWRSLQARGYARARLRFAWDALRQAWRQRPVRVVLAHRHLLPLAGPLRLLARGTTLWWCAYGIEMQAPLGRLERRWARALDLACAISPDTAGRLRAAGWTGRVELWPCSLPWSWEWPPAAPPRFERPWKLLSVARLAPPARAKGLDHTLLALGLLVAAGEDARLDLVGEGDDLQRLQGLVRSQGLADKVRFHGRLDEPDLRALYQACDVFVLPSGAEGFGIVYLEALAFGKPVVAAAAAGAPFVVRPGESGWLVPYGDPQALAETLRRIAAQPAEACRVGLAGRALVKREFSFEHLVARTRVLLEAG